MKVCLFLILEIRTSLGPARPLRIPALTHSPLLRQGEAGEPWLLLAHLSPFHHVGEQRLP